MAASISKTLTRNLLRRSGDTTQSLQLRFLSAVTSAPVTETQPSERGGPSKWSKLLLFVPGVITFGLGTWQIKRRQDKIEMLEYRQNRLRMDPLDCNEVSPSNENVDSLEFCRVHCRGVFDEKKSIFIGPRSRSISGVTENGYYVITPLMPLANDPKSVQAPILVNRGWVPRNWRDKSLEVAAADDQPSRPWRLPFIGNLHQLMNGCLPHHIFRDLSQRSAFGKIIHDQDKLIMLIKDITLLAAGFDLTDLFPSRKWLHGICGLRSKLLKVHKEADTILENIINEHQENRANGKKGNSESGGEELIDVLLRVMESGELGTSITNNNIKAVILDMFLAGAETSSAVIIWALTEMISNPSIMAKAQLEVRQVLKGKKIFEDADLEELKYLKLVIKETLRLHPPLPLLLPRECREETRIGKYTIPIKARVLVNVWAMGRDSEYWHNSESFIPERFDNSSIDFRGNHFEYIPFGAGRRMCPGVLFGLVNVEHPLAQLLYHFDWKTPYEGPLENFDMTETDGVTARRKDDLCLIATPFGLS